MKTTSLVRRIAASCVALAVWTAGAAETVAFLGVGTRPLGPEVGLHVDLPKGVGLLVVGLAPDGPAREALRENDILHKLDDQILVSPEQLSVLVRTRNPGETVQLSFIRRGKADAVSVTLGEIEAARLAPPEPGIRRGPPGSPLPPHAPFQDRLQALKSLLGEMGFDAIERALLEPEYESAPQPPPPPEDPDAPTPPARPLRPLRPRGGGPAGPDQDVRILRSTTASATQIEHGVAVTVRSHNDERTVRIERDGNPLYEGALNSEKDLDRVPEEFRDRVRALRDGIHINIQGPGPMPPGRPATGGPVI
jgi:hypothetical protein